MFDGNTERVFREFFGGDNPFIGKTEYFLKAISFNCVWGGVSDS